MYCTKCGNPHQESDKFCGKCGARFVNSSSTVHNTSNNMNRNNECINYKVNNKLFAWIIALIPLVGSIVGLIIGFGYTCMIFNIIFCYVDEKNLQKQGIDTNTFGDMAWLVPYYLYKRAEILQDSLAYFIVWCVLFALTIFI